MSASDLSRPVPSRSRAVHWMERINLNAVEFVVVALVSLWLIWLCWINFHQLDHILGVLFGRDGTGQDMAIKGIAGALIGLSAYCFYLTGAMRGMGCALAFATGMALSVPSAWSSILYFAHGTEAQLAEERESSARFALDQEAVASARSRLTAAQDQARDAASAMSNVTGQFGRATAAEIGEINRRQMPGYQSTYNAAAAEVQAAQRAYDAALNAARATVTGEGDGPLATALANTGAFLRMESEPMTRATILGLVVSFVGSIILVLIGLHLKDSDGGGTPANGRKRAKRAGTGRDTAPTGARHVAKRGYSDEEVAAMAARVHEAAEEGRITLQDGKVPDRAVRKFALPGNDEVGGGVAQRIRAVLDAMPAIQTREAA